MSFIITYFKLRENQNLIIVIITAFRIITYFKLRENQNGTVEDNMPVLL